ncbi:helix-turn-helix domain-containing protein [Streptomyces cellostaticus]|uniref:NB-ARC domain-containing protein n=1 Tax=Streptomyces TaxID=1883 RepID=UPI002026525D|nr:helix-turn-helix domain-containing protein [Streptomyces cellostaticus]
MTFPPRSGALPDHPGHGPSLAVALARAREAACLTQDELAVRSGLSVRAIRNLETGHTARPRRQSLVLLAEALGLAPAEARRLLRLPRSAARPAGATTPPGARVPAELPPAPRHRLAGRETLADALAARLPGRDGPVVVVGPPGSGKTALALRTAHAARDGFPDGQVYVDLHPTSCLPFTSDQLVQRVLRSLGRGAGVRGPEEARARLRDALSGRRVLVVLDNVVTEAQVRPLLVDGGGSAVLVATRRELPALPGWPGHRIGPLGRAEACRVLADLAGAARVRADRPAVLDIVRYCGGLPLALHLAGLWLSARPSRSPRELADRLADERDRLATLSVGDLSLRASVAAYHRPLPPALKASLHQLRDMEHDFGVEEMMDRVTPSRRVAVDLLEDLLQRQLIRAGEPDRSGRIRYRLHEAVRLYVAYGG